MGDPSRASFGELLRRERRRRRESQRETAARFGLSQPAYCRWETGRNTPEPARYGAIASFLGLGVEDVWAMCEAPDASTRRGELDLAVEALGREVAVLRSALARLCRDLSACDG